MARRVINGRAPSAPHDRAAVVATWEDRWRVEDPAFDVAALRAWSAELSDEIRDDVARVRAQPSRQAGP